MKKHFITARKNIDVFLIDDAEVIEEREGVILIAPGAEDNGHNFVSPHVLIYTPYGPMDFLDFILAQHAHINTFEDFFGQGESIVEKYEWEVIYSLACTVMEAEKGHAEVTGKYIEEGEVCGLGWGNYKNTPFVLQNVGEGYLPLVIENITSLHFCKDQVLAKKWQKLNRLISNTPRPQAIDIDFQEI